MASPIANAKDVCEWLGVDFSEHAFNFHPSVRAACPSIGPLQMNIVAFDHNNRAHRLLQMGKPVYNLLRRNLPQGSDSKALVFVPDRKQARHTALDLVNYCGSDDQPEVFLGARSDEQTDRFAKDIESVLGSGDQALARVLGFGVAFLHSGLTAAETAFIKTMFSRGLVRVLVATNDLSWALSDVSADLVVIQDPEKYNGLEKRY